MLYKSTRSDIKNISASEAILKGLAEDGGLFVPESIPTLSVEEIRKLCSLDYKERAVRILELFLTDFTHEELEASVNAAYGSNKFGKEVAPVVKLNSQLSVLELWHGPTCAFKDMALQLLPQLMLLSRKKQKIDKTSLILVATSGDTGKAALEGFKDCEGIKILVFYPSDGVSDIQKLQMITQQGGNVGVCGIQGNFDDAQSGVKEIFNNKKILDKLDQQNYIFSSANSINWGRLVPQIVYYFSAYCDLVNQKIIEFGDQINFCVPTGNFGNILAGYYAKRMGLFVDKLICASNANNVLTQFIETGEYDKNRCFYETISPSMDILVSSNLERLLFELSGHDYKYVKAMMDSLKTNGRYRIDDEMHKALNDLFLSGYTDDEATKKEIAETFEMNNYLADPHTSVALKVFKEIKAANDDIKHTVVVSTADPYKFCPAVLAALGRNMTDADEFSMVAELQELTNVNAPQSILSLKEKKVLHSSVVEKNDMTGKVLDML